MVASRFGETSLRLTFRLAHCLGPLFFVLLNQSLELAPPLLEVK